MLVSKTEIHPFDYLVVYQKKACHVADSADPSQTA